MDTETDFNNNRRNGFANSDYGSEGSWNAYIPLAKTCLVDWFPILPTLPYMYYFTFTNTSTERLGLIRKFKRGVKES